MKKLTRTYDIKKDATVRLYKKGFGYSLGEVVECNEFYISIIVSDEMLQQSNPGDTIDLYIWSSNDKTYECSVQIIGKIFRGVSIVFLNHSVNIISYKGHRCLEAIVDIPLSFFTFDPSQVKKSISSKDVTTHQGQILMLGDREAVIKSPVKLTDDVFVRGHFAVKDKDVELIGKVFDLNSERNIYIITFSAMEKQQNMILRYIYQFYRE